MEEKKELNLVEILKNCPKGTKLYSTIYGEVRFSKVSCGNYPIWFYTDKGVIHGICKDGRDIESYAGECSLFPSKDNRDWSTFKVEKPKWNPATLQPFDKVLVKEVECDKCWGGDLFLYHDKSSGYPYAGIRTTYKYCIPYNEETKHLLGTSDEAPEYYRL